jgi:hypothetical protein
MQNVNVTKSINVSANQAWEKLSSFRGIEQFSPIERSVTKGEGAGATRTCYLPDGAAIHEVLDLVETQNMVFKYKITDGPFPISNYVSTVKVSANAESSCEVSWSCTFDCDEAVLEDMKNLFSGFYNVIIESLESLINSEN